MPDADSGDIVFVWAGAVEMHDIWEEPFWKKIYRKNAERVWEHLD